jgi:hypothetical protein
MTAVFTAKKIVECIKNGDGEEGFKQVYKHLKLAKTELRVCAVHRGPYNHLQTAVNTGLEAALILGRRIKKQIGVLIVAAVTGCR